MITTVKGDTIDMNGITEWVLFHRMTKRVNPLDFLKITDCLIQLPNFLFSISLFVVILTNAEIWLKLSIPSMFYFFGQLIVNFKIGYGDVDIFKYPLLIFLTLKKVFILGIFVTACFFIGVYALLFIPIYLFTLIISVVILNYYERKYYKNQWGKTTGFYDIFKNNAFIVSYKYFADKFDLEKQLEPTDQELEDDVWLEHLDYMKDNWKTLEAGFNEKAKRLWKAYLHIPKEE